MDGEASVRCVSDTVTEVKIPSEVTIDGATYPVTTIGKYGFSRMPSLRAIHIPPSIREIKEEAFYMTKIENLHIESLEAWCTIDFAVEEEYTPSNPSGTRPGMWHYYYDSQPIGTATNLYVDGRLVTDLVIPESVTEIGFMAFKSLNCRSVTLPRSLTKIGGMAFAGCMNLESVTLPESVTSLGTSAFGRGIRIHIKSLGWWYGLTEHGSQGPHSLWVDGREVTEIRIPDWMTEIPGNLYQCNIGIRDIAFHDKVESIGYSAFSQCRGLTRLSLPPSLKAIGSEAFSFCSGLTEIELPSSLETIGSEAFSYCRGLKKLHLPSLLESIGKEAFRSCESLESLVIPPCKLKRIEECTFSNCTGLKTLYISEPVAYIGMLAFLNCKSLEDVTLPSTIYNLDWGPFSGCQSLKDVYIKSTTLPGSCDFTESRNEEFLANIILHVPEGSLDIYRNEYPWKYFKEIVGTKPEDFPTPQQY